MVIVKSSALQGMLEPQHLQQNVASSTSFEISKETFAVACSPRGSCGSFFREACLLTLPKEARDMAGI